MSANCPTPACLGPGDPETFGHVVSVFWTYLIGPILAIVVGYFLLVFLYMEFKKFRANWKERSRRNTPTSTDELREKYNW